MNLNENQYNSLKEIKQRKDISFITFTNYGNFTFQITYLNVKSS